VLPEETAILVKVHNRKNSSMERDFGSNVYECHFRSLRIQSVDFPALRLLNMGSICHWQLNSF